MFIRRTVTRRTEGRTYHTHRLVRSERDGEKVRQRTLLNLGAGFDLPKVHWPMLCQRIEAILLGRAPLLEDTPTEVEREAQRIAAQLLARAPDGAAARDVQAVDVDSLELTRPRSLGVEQAGLWALGQLGLVEILAELGVNGALRAAATGSIVGRLAYPASERATHAWLGERSALGELLGVDFETMGAMQLYRASDALMKHREAIESHLFDTAMDLFDAAPTVTLYDLTNTYFEGEAADQPKARRGHSKEKRGDCPLLTLGLVLDGSGFVRRSKVFAGNVEEPETLPGMLEALGAPPGARVVMDRGIATEDRAKKERGIAERFARRFEQDLKALHEGLSRPGTQKRIDLIWQRIGRMREKSRGAGQHYDVKVDLDETGQRAVAVHFTRQPLDGTPVTHPGVYCLRSNETDWSEARLWRTYTLLTDLEAVFRSLKSELGLRPIHHRKPRRAEGHLFITVIAYQLVQVIRKTLGERADGQLTSASWSTLRRTLAGRQRVTATFKRADGRTLHVRKATAAEPNQQAILDALGIPKAADGGTRKMIV